MKKILLIHGPNLNMLGLRDEKHYGTKTLIEISRIVTDHAKKFGLNIESFQSNHEGDLIDFLQDHHNTIHGIIINPGALTHYSYALHDALIDADVPAIEVHLSDITAREAWRSVSVTAPACRKVITGKKIEGYIEAVEYLAKLLE